LTTTATIGQTVTEMLLVLFTLIFFLHGSGGIWQFLRPRDALDGARPGRCGGAPQPGRAGRLRSRHRGGGRGPVDAVGIGIGLVVLPWCPLAVPLGALVFLSAVIPVLGSVSLLLELSIGDWTAVWEAQQRSGRPAVLMPCRAGRAG
jgi:hypothetical protein